MSAIRFLAVLSCLALRLWAADSPSDPASVLAHILARKGTITSEELTGVENATAQDRLSVLANLLRKKGVLDEADLAEFSASAQKLAGSASVSVLRGPSSSTSPSSAAPTTVAASSPNAPSAPRKDHPLESIQASTAQHIPVTLYGTLLFNAGFNTAGVNLGDAPSIVAKPGSTADAGNQSFWATPRQTRVGLLLNPTKAAGAELTGAFEMDAYSSSGPFANGINMGLFRLRLAYGRLDWKNVALEIGQDWSIFAPLDPYSLAMYAVAEFNGSGNPWGRVPQVRLEVKHQLNAGNRLLYQISANDPDVGDYSTAFSGTHTPGAGELGLLKAHCDRSESSRVIGGFVGKSKASGATSSRSNLHT